MAIVELGRVRAAAHSARAWRGSRYLPLYLAGLAVGAGIGLGLALMSGDKAETAAPAANTSVEAPIAGPWGLAESGDYRPAAPSNAPAEDGASHEALILPLDLPPFAGRFLPPDATTPPATEPAKEAPVAPSNAPEAAPEPEAPAQPATAPSSEPAAPAPAPAAEEPAPSEPASPPVEAAKPNFHVPDVSQRPATDLELRLLKAANAERAKAGLPAYTYDHGLSIIARTRSQQLVDQGYFGHVDPYGYAMYTELLARFGYTSYAWAGENLALNNYSPAESPERAMAALMNSPSHRANIMTTDFTRVGIGVVSLSDGRHYYTMIFLG